MVTILVEAQELIDAQKINGEIVGGELVGDNYYFLSYGRTKESATKRAIKLLNKMWCTYEFQIHDKKCDLMDFLLTKHWEFCRTCELNNPNIDKEEQEKWLDLFEDNDFTFPTAGRAGTIDVNQNLFDELIGYICQDSVL